MPTPKISVIVPVYKVEKYLNKCVDSIVNQTFTDIEIILVDRLINLVELYKCALIIDCSFHGDLLEK